jgi:Tat protein secretion system quality control protein TatD with DNase activity
VVAARVAELKGISVEQLGECVRHNFQALFRMPSAEAD